MGSPSSYSLSHILSLGVRRDRSPLPLLKEVSLGRGREGENLQKLLNIGTDNN